jgi:hypothetical protein
MSIAERLQAIEGEMRPGETLSISRAGETIECSVGSLCVSVKRGLVRKWPTAVKFEYPTGEGEPELDVNKFDRVVDTGKLPGIMFAKSDELKAWLAG